MALIPASDDVLVSTDFADDAAVVRLGGSVTGPDGARRAIVMTADVIAPLVDDAESFGEIAATNAISDVYAMGGRPLFALNLVFFPDDQLPLEVLHAILRGGARACRRMGVAIVGGHTVRNVDVKYGLSVIGEVDEDRILSNRGARAEQALVLTKALGTGIIGTAIKQGCAEPAQIAAAVASMTTPNGEALRVARRYRVSACTDVTGFGLLGHLRNIVRGSAVDAVIDMASLPVLPGAIEHARAGRIPGGSKANLGYLLPMLRMDGKEDPLMTFIAADAQTSGGLLLCVDAGDASALITELGALGLPAARVGELVARPHDADDPARAAGIDSTASADRATGDGTITLRY